MNNPLFLGMDRNSRWAKGVVLAILALSFAGAAGAQPPPAAPVPESAPTQPPLSPSTGEATPPEPVLPPLGDGFLRAEGFFHSGNLDEARLNYDDFLRTHPNDPRAEQALFRIGEIDYRQRSFASALRLFDYFLENHPGSSRVQRVQIKRGQCLFELGRPNEAEPLFTQALKNNPDGSLRAQALIYLGRIEALRFHHGKALDHLLAIMQSGADPEIKSEASRWIDRLISEGFKKDQLVELARRFVRNYPADRALMRLIQLHRKERDLGGYQIALEDFVSRFPTHPETEKYRKLLQRVKDNPRRIVRVGAVLPLSGQRALVGQKVLQGIQLAFNQLSLREKEKMELVVRDSGLGRSVKAMIEELAEDPNVVGLIGPILSEEVREAAPVLERFDLAAFTPTASSPGLAEISPNIFRNALTREIQAKFLARHAFNELQLNRFVILYPKEPYGEELMELFTREVEAFGGTLVAKVPYERTQNDFREQILQLGGIPDDQLKKIVIRNLRTGRQPKPLDDKGVYSRPVVEGGIFDDEDVEGLKVSLELNYDAIFIPGFYDKVGLIAPQLVFYNIEKVQLLGTNGWNSRELVKNARNYLRSAVFVDGFFPGSQKPQVQEFQNQFATTFGEEPSALAAQAYDSARILIKLVRDGAENRVDILKKLPTVEDFPGVAGRTTILPSGESEKQLAKLRIRGHQIVEME